MSRGANQKFKIPYLMKIMQAKTDDDHSLTMPQIMDELEKYQDKIRVLCELTVMGENDYMGTYAWPAIELLIDYQGAGHMEVVSCDVQEDVENIN